MRERPSNGGLLIMPIEIGAYARGEPVPTIHRMQMNATANTDASAAPTQDPHPPPSAGRRGAG